MGGVPIFIGALFSILLWMTESLGQQNKYLLSTLAIFFVIGLRDDLIPMRPILKLISQLIPILLIAVFSDFQITSFYSVWDLNFSQYLAIPITIFTLVVITNSFNLIDGIDGLAGSIGLIILLTLGFWFYSVNEFSTAFIAFSFCGGLMAFLVYNWSPSKIFMGDTGALTVGFLIGCLIIQFMNVNDTLDTQHPYFIESTVGAAVCLLIVPLTDTLRVFILRLRKSQSPFSADNNHIHHELIHLGLNHSSAALLLAGINLLFIGLIFIGDKLGDKLFLGIAIILDVSLLLILWLFLKRKSQSEKRSVQ